MELVGHKKGLITEIEIIRRPFFHLFGGKHDKRDETTRQETGQQNTFNSTHHRVHYLLGYGPFISYLII